MAVTWQSHGSHMTVTWQSHDTHNGPTTFLTVAGSPSWCQRDCLVLPWWVTLVGLRACFQLTFSSLTSLKECWFEQEASLGWSELSGVSAGGKQQAMEQSSSGHSHGTDSARGIGRRGQDMEPDTPHSLPHTHDSSPHTPHSSHLIPLTPYLTSMTPHLIPVTPHLTPLTSLLTSHPSSPLPSALLQTAGTLEGYF